MASQDQGKSDGPSRPHKRQRTRAMEEGRIPSASALSRSSTNTTTSFGSTHSSFTSVTASTSSWDSSANLTQWSTTSSFPSQQEATHLDPTSKESGAEFGIVPLSRSPEAHNSTPVHQDSAPRHTSRTDASKLVQPTIDGTKQKATLETRGITPQNRTKIVDLPATESQTTSTSLYSSLLLLSSWSIRVLRLLPAASHEIDLHASLSVEKLDERLDYEALSYTWGQPFEGLSFFDSYITIQGHKIAIAGNLDCALRQLRQTDRPRDLWIDALCIDQTHARERGHQIEIMEHIYSRAKRVVVWLGEESSLKDGEYVFDFCKIIERHGARPARRHIAAYQSLWPDHKFLGRRFAERNYFRRRWIIQELCHAADIVILCGGRTTTFDIFCACIQKIPASRRALEQIRELCTTIGHLRHALHNWRARRLRDSQASTLSDFIWILQKFHKFDCSDPRDRLYALMSLWKSEMASPASVMLSGYSSGCVELYIEFASRMIRQHLPDSRVLCHLLSIAADQACNLYPSAEEVELPSWVVDWRHDPAPRIGATDVYGKLTMTQTCDAPLSHLNFNTECYGEIVQADGHYRDWTLRTGQGLLMPSYHGVMPDEDYTASLGTLCPNIKIGDLLCQPISTYRARNRHVADAAIVLRPTGASPTSYRIVGRCPLDLWWHQAYGEDRDSRSISSDRRPIVLH